MFLLPPKPRIGLSATRSKSQTTSSAARGSTENSVSATPRAAGNCIAAMMGCFRSYEIVS